TPADACQTRETMRTTPLLAAVVLSVLPQLALQCATNGLCGYSQCGGAYQAAPAPTCSSYPTSSCRPAYSCGSYGCYRARARSSKTLEVRRFPTRGAALESDREILRERLEGDRAHDTVDEHLERLSETAASLRRGEGRRVDPDRAFHECCLDRKLPDACLAKCHYGAYTKDALTRMYFKQDGCPLEAMAELQFCAAQGRDHRACCARNGVTTTLAGEKCLLFCDQTPGQVTKLDLSFTPCFDRFESMKACFWHDITSFYRA
ncbi:hypothetical protein PFISCL1PPCAC_1411, partial [Pristionchus fissidentatus]